MTAAYAVVAAALALAAAAGCSGDAASARRPPVAPAVGCVPGVSSPYTASARVPPHSLRVGPLVLAGARAWARLPALDTAALHGRRRVLELHVLLRPRRGAVIAVAPAQRAHASLLFQRSRFRADGLYRLADGRPAVALPACPGGGHWVETIGGVLVDRPLCLPLRIWIDGRGRPHTRTLAVARRGC